MDYAALVVNKHSNAKYTLYVGRPTILGNPFKADGIGRERAVRLYFYYAVARMDMDTRFARAVGMCRGRVIACWCAPALCHGHVLQYLANTPKTTQTWDDFRHAGLSLTPQLLF